MKMERQDNSEDVLKVFARECLDNRYSMTKDAIRECLNLLDEADKELSRGTGDGLQHLRKVERHSVIGTECSVMRPIREHNCVVSFVVVHYQ